MKCPIHYKQISDIEFNLLKDHECERISLPLKCNQVVDDFGEEVWYLSFNQKGDKFCTLLKNNNLGVHQFDSNLAQSLKLFMIPKIHT